MPAYITFQFGYVVHLTFGRLLRNHSSPIYTELGRPSTKLLHELEKVSTPREDTFASHKPSASIWTRPFERDLMNL